MKFHLYYFDSYLIKLVVNTNEADIQSGKAIKLNSTPKAIIKSRIRTISASKYIVRTIKLKCKLSLLLQQQASMRFSIKWKL